MRNKSDKFHLTLHLILLYEAVMLDSLQLTQPDSLHIVKQLVLSH